jgi:quercetin dioxygenase-like cupin family protein/DNA-binding transcriptional ArsR family regulator
MPRPRRGHLFLLDRRVLSVGGELHRTGHDEFYGLEVARILGLERSSVYKSLHRLTALGLVEERWDERRRYYRLSMFGRESLVFARLGVRVFGRYQRPGRRVRAMDFTARRIVTGHDADGNDVIVSDGAPPGTIEANGFAVAHWLWLEGAATSVDDGGEVPDGRRQLEPPPGGCSVMLIRFPGGNEWIRVDGDDPDRPGMHATDTLDFVVVLDGRIVLGLDDGEHELGPGDVAVQRGNLHRWRVAGDAPCTYAVCMVRPDPAAGGATVALADATANGDGRPRRLVAATRADGTSYAAADGFPPCVLSPGADDGVALVELWQSGGPLTSPEQGGDPEGGWELEPRGGGVAFRWVRLPAGHDPGEAGWHTTATVDVDIVVSGQLELALPGTEPVVLGPGEAVVQRGTHHKWQPVGDQAVEFVSLMLAVG